jgi:hypothetical protein
LKRPQTSSAVSTTYNISGAAKEVGLPRTTVDAWVQNGVIKLNGLINGLPAFSQGDLDELRKVKEEREQARQILSLKPTKRSSSTSEK